MDATTGLGATAQGLLLNDIYPFQTMPKRLTAIAAWQGHIPFAFWLVRNLKPSLIVELGVHMGDSLCAFSQAVKETGIEAEVVGVDHWKGDDQAGFYAQNVYTELKLYTTENYGGITRLERKSFAEALPGFEEGSIDLLHVDGRHGYEDVKEDFSSYITKLSERAVVLFHDTAVYDREFGVFKYFDEIAEQYPGRTFRFEHCHGLGVLAFGESLPEPVQAFFDLKEPERSIVRDQFAAFGRLVRNEGRIDSHRTDIGRLTEPVAFAGTVAGRDEFSLDEMVAAFHERTAHLASDLEETRKDLEETQKDLAQSEAQRARFEGEAGQLRGQIDALHAFHRDVGFWSFLFRGDGKPKRPVRRLLFHSNGKPRGMFRNRVIDENGAIRPAFRAWMLSDRYLALPQAYRG